MAESGAVGRRGSRGFARIACFFFGDMLAREPWAYRKQAEIAMLGTGKKRDIEFSVLSARCLAGQVPVGREL